MNSLTNIWLACFLCAALLVAASAAHEAVIDVKPSAAQLLARVAVDARDLKTLDDMENAHGQLDEWSARLISRLQRMTGPRERDPVLDGRADLQVQKIAVTYAGYTQTPELAQVLRMLADAHRARLSALQEMVKSGADRQRYDQLDAPIQQLVGDIRLWRKSYEQ